MKKYRGSTILDWASLVWLTAMVPWLAIEDQPAGMILFVLLATAAGAVAGREWAEDARQRAIDREFFDNVVETLRARRGGS